MDKAKNICYDKLLPGDTGTPQRTIVRRDGRKRAIAPRGKQWVNGSTIQIRFLGGTQEQRDMVERFVPEWTEHANLTFEFTDNPRAQVRVSFDDRDGAWSYLGTDNHQIPLHAATMNLGWQDKGVILHEFGHMIGLSHEHQNPEGGIEWNDEVVIADLSGPPNFWDEPKIRHNVLNKYRADQIHGTDFDAESVMLYAFPDTWTRNMGATRSNDDISVLDKQFIMSEKMYPGRGKPDDTATELPVCAGIVAEISSGGEEDLYRFEAKADGRYTIETAGSTDVVMTLFGPNSPTEFVAENDDGGAGSNARITAQLQPGHYYARIRHYNPTRTGEYRISVVAL